MSDSSPDSYHMQGDTVVIGQLMFNVVQRLPSAPPLASQLLPTDVSRLTQLWHDAERAGARRIVVQNGPNALAIVTAIEAAPDITARSVWIEQKSRGKTVTWRWPVDIALLSSADGNALHLNVAQLLKRSAYLAPLLAASAVDRATEADILLLRGSTADILNAVKPPAHVPRAGLVLLLSSEPVELCDVYATLTKLGKRFPASAVACAHVRGDQVQPWLEALVRELSHNETLDVAFSIACDRCGEGSGLLMAPPGFMEHSRLSQSIERLETTLSRPPAPPAAVFPDVMPAPPPISLTRSARPHAMAIPHGSRAESILGMAGVVHPVDVAKALRNVPRDVGFASESGLATASVEIAAAAPHATASVFLQAKLTTDARKPVDVATWLLGQVNVVAVRVGPRDDHWPTPQAAIAFPVEDVLGDEEEATVDVLCYVTGVLKKPLKRKMTVRRIGASSVCRFKIPVHEYHRSLSARIVVMHGRRIVQSGCLVGPMRRHPETKSAEAEFVLDTLIRTKLGGFRSRQAFDACLLIEPGSTVINNPGAQTSFKAPPILSRLLDHFDRQLTDVARYPDKYESRLDSSASVELLRVLARVGSEVREQLEEEGLSDNLIKARRIQVVSTTSSVRVPLEFFYDGRAPLPNATLCDHWKEGLTTGACTGDCPADQGGSAQLCPRRFWGLSRVIERHIESTSQRQWDGDFAVRDEPDARKNLRVFRASAVAGSSRVTTEMPDGLAQLRAQLERNDGIAEHHRLASNWSTWETAIKEESPSFLLLLPHTTMQNIEPQLEIGGDVKLLTNIEVEQIGAPENQPIIALLGCETDTNPTEFFDIVGRCRRRGAVIVIAFGATLAVKHAVPAAQELLEQLSQACRPASGGAASPGSTVASDTSAGGETTLGDVMLATRRNLAANGWVAALGLAAYGDADWKLAL